MNNWGNELQRLIWLFAICLIVGLLTGYIWQVAVAGCLIHIAMNFMQLRRIQQWLVDDGEQDPPEMGGFWGAVCDKIYYLQKQQKRIQSQLEADVAYLRDSFASLTDAVVMVDDSGIINWCNKAALQNLGLSFPRDSGQHLLHLFRDPDFYHYFDSDVYMDGIQVCSPHNSECILWVQVTLFGEGDRLIFARDITEIHRLEQVRRDFVSNVSHELRTPLTVISGYIDNFHAFVDHIPAMAKPLQQMGHHSMRMENLLRDLLDLSRLETLPNEMHKEKVSLSLLATIVVEEAKASLLDRRRQIDVDIEPSIIVYGQQTELHSALLNLVVNACKYTHEDGRIHVSCWIDERGIHFSVQDDGVGIDAIQIPRLTERFYRVDPSRSINTGGTGLGLAIVKRVLLRHDAVLDIESELGKGSTFNCRFALHRLVSSS